MSVRFAGAFALGFAAGLGAVLLHVVLFAGAGDAHVLLIGATQLVYMLPAALLARRKGPRGMAAGILAAASVVVLLNSACWLLFGRMVEKW